MTDETALSTLYYAFSTISQTLGGVLGLVAAFVVIRISGISTEVAETVLRLQSGLPFHQYKGGSDTQPDSDPGWLEHYSRLFATADKGAGEGGRGKDWAPEYRKMHSRGVRLQAARTRLVSDTKCAIAWAAGVIVFSLLGIAAAPWLKTSWLRTYPAIAGGIGGTVVCLYLFWRTIVRALED
jgi:hypothetical protein